MSWKEDCMEIKFNKLGLSNEVLQAISMLGYEHPSKIQKEIIPLILKGNDVIGQAQTGTGKTLAYASAILSKMDVATNVVKAIVLVPTRELAIQVCEEFHALNRMADFDVISVYGGTKIDMQIKQLKRGVDIVVGTPGRVMDLMKRRALRLDHLEYFVLDEADEMLNMGFQEDIEFIFKKTNQNKQVLLLSATMPKAILTLARKYMKKDYDYIAIEEKSKTSVNVTQQYYRVTEKIRVEALCRILDQYAGKTGIIFCQKKKEVDLLLNELMLRNYNVEAMHGDIAQSARIETLDRFKKRAFQYLIATDVAARGIHVDDIDLVINYNLPQDVESYIHRIGRTGRAGKTGIAISLVTNRQLSFLSDIKRIAQCELLECPIPSGKEVMEAKTKMLQSQVSDIMSSKQYQDYIQYVRDYNKEELLQYSAALMKLFLEKELGSNIDKELKVETYQPPREPQKKGTTRLFLTVGKLDQAKRGSILDFIKAETGIRKEHFTGIEVLPKFTFINIDNQVLKEFMKKIRGKKFRGRIIRVEKAKKR